MSVYEVTESEIAQKRERFETVRQIECQVPFHKNGVSTLKTALGSARSTLFREAKQIGAHVVVFEPYVTLPGNGEGNTLILSARAYTYANES